MPFGASCRLPIGCIGRPRNPPQSGYRTRTYSVRRTDEGGWGSHGNAPKRRVFDAQGISPTKLEQIHEWVALLLLIAAAGADGAEKSIAGASGGLPAARCTSFNPRRRQGPGVPPAEWPRWALEPLARHAIEEARGCGAKNHAPWLTDTSQLRDSRDSQLRSVTVG